MEGGYEVKGGRWMTLRSNHPAVSLPNLPITEIEYESASVTTQGVAFQTGDQGQDGLHGLPGWQDQE